MAHCADDRSDDPTYVPDVTAIVTAGGRQTVTVEQVAELVEWGYTLPEVARRLSRHEESIIVTCRRAGRWDLVEAMRETERRRELGRWVA